jgi:putative membrane protein
MMPRWIVHVLQGIFIGAANVIPGVSGGTMALLFGIYERLIAVLGSLFKAGLDLVRLDIHGLKVRLADIPWVFFLSLAAGILLAPIAGAALIPDLLDAYPEISRSLFFGLILGSVPIPWLRISKRTVSQFIVMALSAAVAYYLVGLPPRELVDPSLLAFFLSAAVAICAMILPGVSGAFLLLVLGMYKPLFQAIESFDVLVIGSFALGAALGLGSFALGLKWLLDRYHDVTMAALVGLMVGSLRALWPWLSEDRSLLLPVADTDLLVVVAWGVLGAALSLGMLWWEIRSASVSGRNRHNHA